jgi:cation transport regulator ChaB
MGLKNGLTLPGGIVLNDSYIKIQNFDIINGALTYNFLAYKDKDTRDEDETNTLTVNLSNEIAVESDYYNDEIKPIINTLKAKLYEHAKATEFSTFIDA